MKELVHLDFENLEHRIVAMAGDMISVDLEEVTGSESYIDAAKFIPQTLDEFLGHINTIYNISPVTYPMMFGNHEQRRGVK